MSSSITQITPNLLVYHGNCNVGILRQGDRALLIDCGNGAVQAALANLGIQHIDRLLFTHHHRDSASGVTLLTGPTTRIGVPAAEQAWFDAVETFWHDPQMRWHLYNVHPHNLMLATSAPVQESYVEGDQLRWGAALIRVLETPGHTDGSVAYLVEIDGQQIVFAGDTIYGDGHLWDLYSLQKRGETTIDYHGFLGDRTRLLASLEKILATQPDLLIPTHGPIIRLPTQAVAKLRQRIERCYNSYVAISALRYYFPHLFQAFVNQPDQLPIGAGLPVPVFLRHVSTTWIVIAENGEALVMDCGSPTVIQALQQWQRDGTISQVTACWVTHYHDDHVDCMPEFQAAFPCPTYADQVVAAVIEKPQAWRLPCISPAITRIDQRTVDGTSWQWNEFRLTAYHFPGQTYYHGGLLVEGHGLRLFFSGDSFTPAGIDDYCAGNRNLLGAGVGYERCLALLAQLQPTHIFNCHVNDAFAFTPAEIDWMQRNLVQREELYGELIAWDHPNYGMDEHWVHPLPYEQTVQPGQTVQLNVVFTNHSAVAQTASCRPQVPLDWRCTPNEQQITIPAKQTASLQFALTPPAELPATGTRLVAPIEVTYAGKALGQFREAILQVSHDA